MTKRIVYSCPFVPAEWIAAHGMQPSLILPEFSVDRRSSGIHAGICPYAREFMNTVCSEASGDAVVFTTVCDQMRRMPELMPRDCDRPVFLMNVPSTWQHAGARQIYVDELERLGRFMVRLGGSSPSREYLAKVMREYDDSRMALRKARGYLTAREYSEAIAAFHRGDRPSFSRDTNAQPEKQGVSLALLGSPLMGNGFWIFDLIEQTGGRVVLDATESGEISLPGPFHRLRLNENPMSEIIDAYFGAIPGVFRRPNSGLYDWLGREIRARGVRGILLLRYVWCDLWHAEVERMKEVTGLPVVDMGIESSDEASMRSRFATRIQALLELVR
ncbi:MAG: 2-hydroxyacyl-CoA dehydratase family protein [bacterium]